MGVRGNKDKGTRAEGMVASYLKGTYWPFAERRALAGSFDKGDITGTPALVWEVKSATRLTVPAWLRETEVERVNAGADYGVLVIKPSGVGVANIGKFYALMDKEKFNEIPWAAAPNSYNFSTTQRKMKFNVAIDLADFTASQMHYPTYWVNYPDFVLTTLAQMAKILNGAGYGTLSLHQSSH
jgi:hypothetical protein